MISKRKLLLTGVAIIILTFLVSWYFVPTYMVGMLKQLSKTQYQDDYTFAQGLQSPSLLFLIFSIVAYCCNLIILKKVGKLTISRLWILSAIDQLVLPVCICWKILLNNSGFGMPGLMSLISPIAIAGVLLFKHVLVYIAIKVLSASPDQHTSH